MGLYTRQEMETEIGTIGAERKLEAMADTGPDAIFRADMEGDMTYR